MANIIRKEDAHKINSIKEYSFSDLDSFLACDDKEINDLCINDEINVPNEAADGMIRRQELQKQEEFNLQIAVEAAIQKGHEEGFSQGLTEAKKTLEDTINKVNLLAQELAAFKSEILSQAEDEVLKLALAIAKKVILEEPKQNPNVIKNVVKEAIKQLIDKDGLVIKLNSADLDSIKEIENQLFTPSAGVCCKVKIVADDFVARGGCIVEAQSGSVDADLKTQCEEIEGSLLGNNTGSNEESD